MKKGVWIVIAVGIVFILVGVVIILMLLPLGPALLGVATSTPLPTQTFIVSPTPTETPTPGQTVCGSGSMLFLVIGESQLPRGTDAIRLVRVDFDRVRVDVLSLPPELWVSTPALYARGISGDTLNELYLQGKSQTTSDEQARMLAAVDLFASTLQSDFLYMPEHYLVIKQAAFSEFVDDLNGVDVVLPLAVDGRPEGKGYFPAGTQHLTGAMALDLVRISTGGEWDRFDRQELILQAIYQAMMAPKNWDQLPAMVETFHNNIFTDLSVNQILDISCILRQTGVVVNQVQVGTDLVVFSDNKMLPRAELGIYIKQTVGK